MRTFDEQYRFIRMARHDDAIPSLKPDPANPWWDDAGDMPADGPPWVFHNVWKMQNRSRKIQEKVGEVLFEGSDLVVSTRIRDALVERGIPDLHTVPAVYVDDHDVRHAGYWYLAFTRRFDCWDRQASTCEGEPIVGAGMEIHDVTKFRLDAALLGRTPLAHRLLFKMGGSQEAFITVHEDLLPVFGDGDALGVEFQRVIDY